MMLILQLQNIWLEVNSHKIFDFTEVVFAYHTVEALGRQEDGLWVEIDWTNVRLASKRKNYNYFHDRLN